MSRRARQRLEYFESTFSENSLSLGLKGSKCVLIKEIYTVRVTMKL